MKKIAIVSKDLRIGGIQRSLINFLVNINFNKYKVDCYLYNKENFYKDIFPKEVNIYYLSARPSIIKFIPFNIVKLFAKSQLNDNEYDYVIDYDGYQTDTAIDTILSNGKNKVCWIHQDVLLKKREEKKYAILHLFMKKKYQYYNKFVGVSKGIIKPFEELNEIDIRKNSLVIPNYIDTKVIFIKAQEPCNDLVVDKNKYNFVSVGRICKAKGYDILINYLKELAKYRTDFHFYLIGDGIDKSKLIAQVNKLNLNSYITFLGSKQNPFKYESLMDGFVMTSRYEGQGMALWEAKSLGLEIFMTKNLEKYNDGLIGYDNMVDALSKAQKKKKKYDNLDNYNKEVKVSIERLFE